MKLRQPEIIRIEVKIPQIVMGLRVSGIVLQRSAETVKGFDGVSELRFDDAQVAVGVRNTILLFDGPDVELRGRRVAAFVQHQRPFEATEPPGELQNLRGRPREEVQLIGILELLALPDSLVPKLRGLSG